MLEGIRIGAGGEPRVKVWKGLDRRFRLSGFIFLLLVFRVQHNLSQVEGMKSAQRTWSSGMVVLEQGGDIRLRVDERQGGVIEALREKETWTCMAHNLSHLEERRHQALEDHFPELLRLVDRENNLSK